MESIWEILGIEQTGDRTAIKRAYAKRARECNPEDSPEEFLRIRDAYEKAAAYAEEEASGGGSGSVTESGGESGSAAASGRAADASTAAGKAADVSTASDGAAGAFAASDAAAGAEASSGQGFRWDFTWENPFREGEGIRRFRELYTGKRRKDRTAWTDFFLSPEFLEGYREKAFAELMVEAVRENAQEYPPGKEFLTELYIAYGLSAYNTGDGISLQMEENAAFPGIAYIGEIAGMGPAVTRFKGNDPAMAAGFRDYREMLLLEAEGAWTDDGLFRLGKVIDGYQLANISDRPIQNAYQYDLYQRHPKSLKLLNYFFVYGREKALPPLPGKVYRMLWSHLGLEGAVNGREKLLYGVLREAVLAHEPKIGGMRKFDLKELTRQFFYGRQNTYYTNEGTTPELREELDQFFQREDVQYALRDEAYVDKQILHYWITKNSGSYLLDKLEAFYESHREVPLANRILENIAMMKEAKWIEAAFQEDEHSETAWEGPDFGSRAFVRYYLHTAFHMAQGIQNAVILSDYLQKRMPYSADWSRRFADPEADSREDGSPEQTAVPGRRSLEIRFGEQGENILTVRFYSRYVAYLWNGKPLVPRFPGQELAGLEEDAYFWLLAPIASAPFEEHSRIYTELVNRLARLPVWEADIPVIADCIAGSICRFEEDEVPLCSLYAQKEEQLFGCDIFGNGVMVLYEEMPDRKVSLPGGQYQVPDLESAVKMGKRLLWELTMEWDVEVRPERLPRQILVRNRWNMPSVLAGEEVTQEAVQECLKAYFADNTRRLELDFGGRALVFVKDEMGQYACFYFEHEKRRWFGLVGMPEVYEVVDEKDVVYVPFGLGMLPDYLVHQNLGYMKCQLEKVFGQVACEQPDPAFLMWSSHVYFTAEAQRYRLAQRLFGAYPPEQACSRMQESFFVPKLPARLFYVDTEGNASGNLDVSRDKQTVQALLSGYMAGRLERLVLTWQFQAEHPETGNEELLNRQILLRQDQGCHQMIYLDGSRKGMEYLVSDVKEYLDAEGKKYRKAVFHGRKVPAYLVHTDLRRIRDCLDLLIPQIEYPAAILGQFGEFSFSGGEDFERMREYLPAI